MQGEGIENWEEEGRDRLGRLEGTEKDGDREQLRGRGRGME